MATFVRVAASRLPRLAVRPMVPGVRVLARTLAATPSTTPSKSSGEMIMNFPDIAMRLVKSLATAKFNETVDLALQLSVDPRKPGQNVRGMAMLPFGTGKKEVVAVFAKGEKAEEARRAGADLVGAEDLVERIQKGELSFTKAIATPDVMPLVGRVARILGPRGLMPNPKLGTVTADVAGAIGAARRGQVEFKVEKKGILHAPIGKVSFSEEQLMENLRSLMLAVNDARPETVKGVFMKHAFVSSTMGRSVAIDIATLDPSKPRFMQTADMAKTAAAAAASAGGRA